MPLSCPIRVFLRHFGFLGAQFCFAKENIPKTIRDKESLWIGLSFLMYNAIRLRSDRGMDVESRLFGFSRQNSKFLRKNFLLLKSHLLISKKHDPTIRDDDGEFANQLIRVWCMNEITKVQIRVLATDSGSDFEIVVMVETPSGLKGLATKFGR